MPLSVQNTVAFLHVILQLCPLSKLVALFPCKTMLKGLVGEKLLLARQHRIDFQFGYPAGAGPTARFDVDLCNVMNSTHFGKKNRF